MGKPTKTGSAAPAVADRTSLRRALGAFMTGVTVVTTVDGRGHATGLTANSFTSVSLEPPLVLVCLARGSSSLAAIRASGIFAVNVLSQSQRDLAARFATRDAEKFAGISWRAEATGAPVLVGCAAYFDCQVHATLDGGDHEIVVGRVRGFGDEPRPPLGYLRGSYVAPIPASDQPPGATDGAGA